MVKRGNWSSVHPVVPAMALGWIDYHLFDPWFPLEQILYPSISEFSPPGTSPRHRRPSRSGSSASKTLRIPMKCGTC